MIQLVNLRRNFKDKIVFDGFSNTFDDHGFYILKGDNGCGKTTLLYFLALLDDGFRGKYLFDGVDLNSCPFKEREKFRSENISLLLPRGNLLDFLDVGENRNLLVKDKALDFDHLEDRRSVFGLSGGEEILLSLSNEVSKKKKLYLLDEVTSSLSDDHVREVLDILMDLSKDSLVILASHDVRVLPYGKIVNL